MISTVYPNAAAMLTAWADPAGRSDVIAKLEERGINFDELAASMSQPDADPFDLLCHVPQPQGRAPAHLATLADRQGGGTKGGH